MEFFTAKDIAYMFGLKTPLAARKLMQDWGVPGFNLGVGRKRGYRWKKSDVLAALESRAISSYSPVPKKKKAIGEDGDAFWSQELSKIRAACARI